MLWKEKETSQINNLSSHLKNLGKDEQNKPKTSRRRDKDQSKDQENWQYENNKENQCVKEVVLWKYQ